MHGPSATVHASKGHQLEDHLDRKRSGKEDVRANQQLIPCTAGHNRESKITQEHPWLREKAHMLAAMSPHAPVFTENSENSEAHTHTLPKRDPECTPGLSSASSTQLTMIITKITDSNAMERTIFHATTRSGWSGCSTYNARPTRVHGTCTQQ